MGVGKAQAGYSYQNCQLKKHRGTQNFYREVTKTIDETGGTHEKTKQFIWDTTL